MPGKCFPLGFSQQIFALKGNVCSASGCGTAAASTGWGPRDPVLGPGADTAHIHTRTHRGHLRSPGEVRVTGTGMDTDLWGPCSSLGGHRRDQGIGGWSAFLSLGLCHGAAATRREACTCLAGACVHSPGTRGQPAECASNPGWPSAPPIPKRLPMGGLSTEHQAALSRPLASAPGGTSGCGQPPRGSGGGRGLGRGDLGQEAPDAPPLRPGPHSSLPRGPSHGQSGRGAEEVGAMQG